MPGIKELKNRIRSVKSTRKITKAMQMVSAAKMRKAQTAVVNSRTYAGLARELIESVMLQSGSVVSPFMGSPKDNAASGITADKSANYSAAAPLLQTYETATKTGVILLSTNTGLVGGLNNNLIPKVRGVETVAEIITYGKKAKNIAKTLQKTINADFEKKDRFLTSEDIYPLAQYVSNLYKTGQYKKIVIVYNQYVSTLVQKAIIKQLLPFTPSSDSATMPDKPKNTEVASKNTDYLFEPTPAQVLEHLIPRIIESQIYQAILESNASEHSARMVMMKNATEAAGDLIDDYTLTYNQLRQGKITTELSEITAGRIALE